MEKKSIKGSIKVVIRDKELNVIKEIDLGSNMITALGEEYMAYWAFNGISVNGKMSDTSYGEFLITTKELPFYIVLTNVEDYVESKYDSFGPGYNWRINGIDTTKVVGIGKTSEGQTSGMGYLVVGSQLRNKENVLIYRFNGEIANGSIRNIGMYLVDSGQVSNTLYFNNYVMGVKQCIYNKDIVGSYYSKHGQSISGRNNNLIMTSGAGSTAYAESTQIYNPKTNKVIENYILATGLGFEDSTSYLNSVIDLNNEYIINCGYNVKCAKKSENLGVNYSYIGRRISGESDWSYGYWNESITYIGDKSVSYGGYNYTNREPSGYSYYASGIKNGRLIEIYLNKNSKTEITRDWTPGGGSTSDTVVDRQVTRTIEGVNELELCTFIDNIGTSLYYKYIYDDTTHKYRFFTYGASQYTTDAYSYTIITNENYEIEKVYRGIVLEEGLNINMVSNEGDRKVELTGSMGNLISVKKLETAVVKEEGQIIDVIYTYKIQ